MKNFLNVSDTLHNYKNEEGRYAPIRFERDETEEGKRKIFLIQENPEDPKDFIKSQLNHQKFKTTKLL